ncbi:MAG: ribbon-helix-helix domain-containing protein [Pseudonocardiaceae bacterium]
MVTTKITVTVPEELAAHIRQEVEQGRYASVSAFVTQAVASMRDFEPLDLLIASMIAEAGQPDEVAQAWVAQAMATARGRGSQKVPGTWREQVRWRHLSWIPERSSRLSGPRLQ